MSILEYNEVKEGKIIDFNDEPCEVLESHVARTQQRKPQNQVKLKSLISGKTFNATYHTSDKADESDISKKDIKFLYHNRDEYWFSDIDNPKNRFKLDVALMEGKERFLKDNLIVTSLVWGEDEDDPSDPSGQRKIIKVALPIKLDFVVKEAPPAVKGDTAKGGNKQITLENGATINAPLFVNEGDVIKVNTETGEYAERV